MEFAPESREQIAPAPLPAPAEIGNPQAILAALDAALDLHLSGAPLQQVSQALHELRDLTKSYFDGQDRTLASFRGDGASAHMERHGSLIRYIDHAIANIGQWSSSQRYIHLRFMNHSITAHINSESSNEDPELAL